VLIALIALAQFCFGEVPHNLEVSKSVTPAGADGVFTVSVGYKLSNAAPGRVFGVTIIDSLPSTLDLVSGDLVVKGEDPTDDSWIYNTYKVKAAAADFTIEKRSVDVVLPPAEVSWSQNAGNVVTNHTVHTKPVSLVAELVIPKGTIAATPVIAFFTLLFPLAMAVYLIPFFRNNEVKNIKLRKQGKEKKRT